MAQGLGAAAGSFMANQQREFDDEELFTREPKFVLHLLFMLLQQLLITGKQEAPPQAPSQAEEGRRRCRRSPDTTHSRYSC